MRVADERHICIDCCFILCEVLKFDPNKTTYHKERIERVKQETGKTYYEMFNKKYYEKNKEELDRKNVERTRKRRASLKASKEALALDTEELKKEIGRKQ
jgi:hypothetical protein